MKRILYIIAGWVSILLGVIGILLPVVPTVPFILFASFCFTRGSERWHAWLLRQPYIGQMVLDWERNHSIPVKAKAIATLCVTPLFIYSIFLKSLLPWVRLGMSLIGICVLTYIWTRPSR